MADSHQKAPSAAELFSAWDSTESGEAASAALKELKEVVWAKPLLDNLSAQELGDRGQRRAYIWEARIAHSIHRSGWQAQYEYKAGQGEQSIDFRVMSQPELWIEAISIQNSDGSERAGTVTDCISDVTVFGIDLTSANPDETQTTAGEMVRVSELLAGKASKFPSPRPQVYHLVVADIRGYNAGVVDLDDCAQIIYGPVAVKFNANRQFFRSGPVKGVFDNANRHPGAVRAQQKIHAIGLFCGPRNGSEDVLSTQVSVYGANPSLIANEQEWISIADVLDNGWRARL